jgi:hypothetical protein
VAAAAGLADLAQFDAEPRLDEALGGPGGGLADMLAVLGIG